MIDFFAGFWRTRGCGTTMVHICEKPHPGKGREKVENHLLMILAEPPPPPPLTLMLLVASLANTK